jgi:phage-related baseplate assembly protein
MPATTVNLIDLSQLPAPDVIEPLGYEAILAEMKAELLDAFPAYDVDDESDPAIKTLEIAAAREVRLRQRVNDAARAVLLAKSQGNDLVHLGAYKNVEKLTGESDDAFRARIQLAPDSWAAAGPEGAYVFHAKSAHPDVEDASCTSPNPCEIVIAVMSKTGNGDPEPAVIEAVEAALSAANVRPLADQVTVQAAAITAYTLDADIYTYSGPDVAVVLAEARARVDRYHAQNRRLGRDHTLSGLIAALHADGVQRVVLNAPAADVVVNDLGAAYCDPDDIVITHAGYAA